MNAAQEFTAPPCADTRAIQRGKRDGRYWRKLTITERAYRESRGNLPASPYNGAELSAEWLAGFIETAGPTTPRSMAQLRATNSREFSGSTK